jgi:pimeloyl-ACP methyl ester carboxylesterase
VTATDDKALDGKATHKTLEITVSNEAGGKSFSYPAHLFIPNGLGKPAPAFVLINNRPVSSADPTRKEKAEFWPVEEIVARGYATAVFQTNDVDPDKSGPEARAKGIRAVLASPGKEGEDAWATIGAWAFAASRVLDYLETDKQIDAKHVAIIGHSRGGKTALWAGAQDPRFALVCSSCSGCTGAALNRRIFGETVAAINKGFPYWFCGNFHQFDDAEEKLPVDQHQLLALIAPRGLCVGSADADFWADQRGEFLSLAASSPVYGLYGFEAIKDNEMPGLDAPFFRTPRSYHVRRGIHNLLMEDWKCYMDVADQLWR